MKKKIFTVEQIYDAVSAAHAAQGASDETGAAFHWQEYGGNEDSEERDALFDSLPKSAQGDFEEQLENTAREQADNFSNLENLSDDDFSSTEEYLDARQKIIDDIQSAIEVDFEKFIK